MLRILEPLMLIHGDRDQRIPLAHSQAFAARASDARVVVIPGAGHSHVQRFTAYQMAIADAPDALP